jgi:hypothetical protein
LLTNHDMIELYSFFQAFFVHYGDLGCCHPCSESES